MTARTLVLDQREWTLGMVADGVPELVIEILSPNTRLVDVFHDARFARAGCPSFWLVDLEMPAVTAYALDGDTYCQIAHVTGEQPWAAVPLRRHDRPGPAHRPAGPLAGQSTPEPHTQRSAGLTAGSSARSRSGCSRW